MPPSIAHLPLGTAFGLALLAAGCAAPAPREPGPALRQAADLLASGQAQAAARLAERVRALWPELPEATLIWAFASKEIALAREPQDYHLLDSVEQACRELSRLEGSGVEAWYALGLVRRDRGDRIGAAHAWREALALDPFHPRTLRSMAALEFARGRERAAALLYDRLLRVPPPDPEVHYRLGVCALADIRLRRDLEPSDLDSVEGHFREALKLQDGHPEALRGLAWITVERSRLRGRWAEPELRMEDGVRAAALLETALAGAPAHPDCNHDLGWILAELGRAEEAEVLFSLAIAADPDHGPALADLALVRERRGAPPAEVAALRRRALETVREPALARALQLSLDRP